MAADDVRAEAHTSRAPDYEIESLLYERWSPRSMTGERLSEDEFMPLFEAARWAPSSMNRQPWRYRYATRQGDDWEAFLDLLYDGNRRWAQDASLLVLVLSLQRTEDGDSIHDGSFATGASWQNLALEGTRRGLAVHPMLGFDREAARESLDVPEDLRIECVTAVGPKAAESELDEELRDRETASGRKPLSEIVAAGGFDP